MHKIALRTTSFAKLMLLLLINLDTTKSSKLRAIIFLVQSLSKSIYEKSLDQDLAFWYRYFAIDGLKFVISDWMGKKSQKQ